MAMPRKLILLCDGTWCGREANTETNIHLLAKMIGVDMNLEPALLDTENVKAFYAPGIGVGRPFFYYILDGATGRSIGDECKAAYQFIVENYTTQHEIWMFGLSRGAFIVRSVAGMINNCGIIRLRQDNAGNVDREETRLRCKTVYGLYYSEDDEDHPQSDKMKRYRRVNSHDVRTPVKFMGLFDTVGSLGVPAVLPREGFVWPESFRDKSISSVVENVYHAISMHDRLRAFTPSLACRNPKHGNNALPIHEKWLPGAHYDLGRQTFRFLRSNKPLAWIPNAFAGTVEPNEVLSDLTLRWMLESIWDKDPVLLIPDINNRIQDINNRLQQKGQNTGSGDVYDKILEYLPLGKVTKLASTTLSTVWPSAPQKLGNFTKSILGVATETDLLCRDRAIPQGADVYNYRAADRDLGERIEDLARLNERRYPSRSYDKFERRRQDLEIWRRKGCYGGLCRV